ncbi:MAG: SUMF1/EgtB/PvdO family nonheme iron enzyme [Saprospiraceae bacterium]|nr:SUMF1/EgtB/PvdO family nonheme iron enzyme [Saprospiraceae bacterium]
MIRLVVILIVCLSSSNLISSNISVDNIRLVNRDGVAQSPFSIIFDISWDNAWHNEKNHDAAWVFMKYSGYWNNHVKVAATGHRVLKNRTESNNPTIQVSEDGVGLYILPPEDFRGHTSYKVQIVIDTTGAVPSWSKIKDVKVHAIEMVYIPQGGFEVGSPDADAIKRAAFYSSNNEGGYKGSFTIKSEDEIQVGPEEDKFYYWSESALYNGDQKGPIPSDFPKGYDAFYIMKYELTQGQYAAFLNDIPVNWTYLRSPLGGRDYYKKRGGIRLEKGIYKADAPTRPMNYVSFTDGLAYSDWAGLRPITELEYEKAARGPAPPKDAEFVWGTSNYNNLERYVNTQAELVFTHDIDEGDLNDDNRDVFGASYYWVMDLSGSVWEKVITVGNEIGRQFKGSHGDGNLDFGNATNEDWPTSDNEKGGFGYRGGGYYEVGTTYSDFNPHSPIGYRYYGAWSGGPRYISYGYRAGRSAD